MLYGFLFSHFLTGSAVKQSVLSKHHQTRLKPFDEVITIKPQRILGGVQREQPVGRSADDVHQLREGRAVHEQPRRRGSGARPARARRFPTPSSTWPHERHRHLHVSALAAPGTGQPDHRERRASAPPFRSIWCSRASKLDGGSETRPPIHRDIEIYGPGDVTGLDPRAIIKTEPLHYITNFEPNYLAYIDFYDEDLPWRYSPVVPTGHRLLPWMMLIVLKETEFKDGRNVKDHPLPYILPAAGRDASAAGTTVGVGARARQQESDRIGVPLDRRRGDRDAAEADARCGRRHGLLADPLPATSRGEYVVSRVSRPLVRERPAGRAGPGSGGSRRADTPAWTDAAIPTEIPFYHRWYFRTGSIGDFEYLVRLLKPQPIDSRVGLRDMDVQKPGANIRGIVDAPGAPPDQALGGILKLGGVLRIPDAFYTPEELAVVLKYRNWATLNGHQPYPHPFQQDVAAFINLTAEYEDKSAAQANADTNITEEQTGDRSGDRVRHPSEPGSRSLPRRSTAAGTR